MTNFIDTLDQSMTKAQFVLKYGRYVPNGFSLGCTVKHQISLSCRTTETTTRFETTLKASLKGSNYNADFAANLKRVIGNNDQECSFTGSAQIVGPTNLLSTPVITSIDDIQTLMNDVKNMPSICANADQRNLGYVRLRYMPWKFVDRLPDQWKSDVDQDDPKNLAVQSDFVRLKSLIQANEMYESDITYGILKKLRFYNRHDNTNINGYKMFAIPVRRDYQFYWSKFTNEVVTTEQLTVMYNELYHRYKQFIKPKTYVITVQQRLRNNNYITHNFNMNMKEIIADENNNDNIYSTGWKCLKYTYIFPWWHCTDYNAMVDFTQTFPVFTVERRIQNRIDGRTILDFSAYPVAIQTPHERDQLFPMVSCFKPDSWCFMSVPPDDWFFILIRPL
jgi:hypothetical protein